MKLYEIFLIAMVGGTIGSCLVLNYDIIRHCWIRHQYSVKVYIYFTDGKRDEIFCYSWQTYAENRAAGQAIINYLESQDNKNRYTFEVICI